MPPPSPGGHLSLSGSLGGGSAKVTRPTRHYPMAKTPSWKALRAGRRERERSDESVLLQRELDALRRVANQPASALQRSRETNHLC